MLLLQLLAFVVLLFLPGLSAALIITKSLQKSLILSVPVSCAMAYSVGTYSAVLGLPFVKTWVVVASISLVGACIFVLRAGIPTGVPPSALMIVSGALAVCCSAKILHDWHSAAGSFTQLLPNHDAMYHGYAIRNILNSDSNTVDRALMLFPDGAGSAADFYPLGLHSVIALCVAVSGISINLAMNLVTIGVGLCLFPMAMLLWVRCLLPGQDRILVASVPATLMVATVFPLSPLSWGGMPAIVAMTMAPAIASVLVSLIRSRTTTARLTISVTLVGVFSVHTTELVTIAFLVLIALITRGESKVLVNWIRSTEPLRVGVFSGLFMLPVVAAARGGALERALQYQSPLDLVQTMGNYLLFSFSGFVMPVATVLCVIGIVQSSRYRLAPVSFSILALGILCGLAVRMPENSLIGVLTKPWYGQVLRLNYNIVYFAIPLIAVGLTHMFDSILEWRVVRCRSLVISVAVLTVLGVVTPAIGQSNDASDKLLASWYNGLIPVNQNSVAAFNWISQNIESHQYVMTDVDGIDGSTWMYALANVKPIMYGAITSDSRDKWRTVKNEILQTVGNLSHKPHLVAWLREKNIRYFYFDERTNAISPEHTVTLDSLRSDSMLEEVLHLENAHVFEFSY